MPQDEFTRVHLRIDGPAGGSPVGRFLGALAGVAMFVLAVVLGGVILLVFLALATAIAAALGVRLWWWQRQARKSGRPASEARPDGHRHPHGQQTIDGEFRVIDDD